MEDNILWIKLSVGLFENKKIALLKKKLFGTRLVLLWIRMLTVAAKLNYDGAFLLGKDKPLTLKELASMLDTPVLMLRYALNHFERLGLVSVEDGVLYVTSWREHQSIRRDVDRRKYMREYMSVYRKQRKQVLTKSVNTIEKEKEYMDRLTDSTTTIKTRVEWDCISRLEQRCVEEIITVIAETEALPDDSVLIIDGIPMPCSLVKSVYARLTKDHLLYAYEKFKHTGRRVKKLKDFLRTLVYNVILEMEPELSNIVWLENRKP